MNSKITPAEEIFCMYKLNMEGSFMTSLINTIFKGDIINQTKLSKGFPELVGVCQRFSTERGYWENLVNRWNEEFPTRKLYV
jgi:hypothetical protein